MYDKNMKIRIYEVSNDYFEKKPNKKINRLKKNASRKIRAAIKDYRQHGWHKVARVVRTTDNNPKVDYWLYEKEYDQLGDWDYRLLGVRMITSDRH